MSARLGVRVIIYLQDGLLKRLMKLRIPRFCQCQSVLSG